MALLELLCRRERLSLNVHSETHCSESYTAAKSLRMEHVELPMMTGSESDFIYHKSEFEPTIQ